MTYNKKIAILILLALLIMPAHHCFASKTFEWNDINKPLGLSDGYNMRDGILTIKLDISSEVIKSSQPLILYLKYKTRWSKSTNQFFLKINDSVFRYRVKSEINIFKRHLVSGTNIFQFYVWDMDQTGVSSDCDIEITRIRFTPSGFPPTNNKLIAQKTKEPKKNESTFLSDFKLKRALNAEINKDSIAVVIGNNNYIHKDIPDVKFAINDASAIKTFLIKTLGYREDNIIYEIDASKSTLERVFGTQYNHEGILYNYIKPEKSEVFIYYSGHGCPDIKTKKAYIVPTDFNPSLIDLTAYQLDILYNNIPKIEAKRATVVIDACEFTPK